MWMGMTLWSMGSHSILGALWVLVGLMRQATGNKKSSSCGIHLHHPPGQSQLWPGGACSPEDSTLMACCKLGSIVLDHHARYTEADVIPCTGEEPGEAKEREALRGAVLKQVWAQAWVGGAEREEALRQGSTQY